MYTQCVRKFTKLFTIFALSTFVLSSSAFAGSGTFEAGQFNFCVSIRFNATNAQITEMQQAFQKGSDILLDATDGQHRFGTVNFVNNSGASNNAEYWINQASGRAYATYGKYGTRGEHVMLYYPDNISGGGSDGNAYTVAHEHAHHAYGVADEYSGRVTNPDGTIGTGAAECASAESATLNYSLMDNYFSRGGNFGAGTTYTLNEFCITTADNAVDNHDPDNDTYQQSINGESAWETVAKAGYTITAPAGLPTDAAPASQAVTFNTVSAGLRAILVLDRSGSMTSSNRIDLLKSAAKIFVNALSVGDQVGIASFSSASSLDFALTTIAGATERTAAKAAIDALTASGSTNIGGGMTEGLNQLNAMPGCADVAIVLSDGDHNTGTDPSTVTPMFKALGIPVITVGLGNGISTSGQQELQAIANGTGGSYSQVSSAAALPGLFLNVVLQTIGGGLLAQSPLSTITPNTTQETTVTVEAGSSTAFFQLGFLDATDILSLQLVDPLGTTITCGAPPAGVTCDATDPNSVFFEVANPTAGAWKMQVVAGATINTGEYQTAAGSTSDGTAIDAGFENDDVEFPAPLIVRATLRESGEAVAGASVTGIVTRPDDSTVNINLFDDGNPANGDQQGGDGVYSARFNAYCDNCDGSYTFRIDADGTGPNVTTVEGESGLFAPRGIRSNKRAVNAFERSTTVSAIVSNVPTSVPQADVLIGTITSSETKTDLIYTIPVTNNGPDDAETIVLTDFLAEELEFVSCSSSGSGVCTGGKNTEVAISGLTAGATETITLTTRRPCTASAGTDLTNVAIATATTSDPDSTNNRGTLTIASTACSDCTVKDYTTEFAVIDQALQDLKKLASKSVGRARKAGADTGKAKKSINKFGKKSSQKLNLPAVITDCPLASCAAEKLGTKQLFSALRKLRSIAKGQLKKAQRAGVKGKALKTLRTQINEAFAAGNAFKDSIPENNCTE